MFKKPCDRDQESNGSTHASPDTQSAPGSSVCGSCCADTPALILMNAVHIEANSEIKSFEPR